VSGELSFWKMEGAGNDFVVIDARDGLPLPAGELAQRLCARGTGVGADGLLALIEAEEGRIAVEYRNADGSQAGFCGNGARCAARFAVERGLAESPLEVRFPGHTVTASVDGQRVAIRGRRPVVVEERLALPLAGGEALDASLIDAGVLHVVAREPAGRHLELEGLLARLSETRADLAGRVNLTVVREASGATLLVRTFERGSGETLACGSGAWAAAAFCEHPRGGGGRFRVLPPGGTELLVDLAPGSGQAVLEGPARVVFRGLLAEW